MAALSAHVVRTVLSALNEQWLGASTGRILHNGKKTGTIIYLQNIIQTHVNVLYEYC